MNFGKPNWCFRLTILISLPNLCFCLPNLIWITNIRFGKAEVRGLSDLMVYIQIAKIGLTQNPTSEDFPQMIF